MQFKVNHKNLNEFIIRMNCYFQYQRTYESYTQNLLSHRVFVAFGCLAWTDIKTTFNTNLF